jgi:hypothetical protein
MAMMEDAVKTCQIGKGSGPMQVMDVAELLWESVRDEDSQQTTRT